ncbi:hypothetical protein Hanom_Chr14g01303621 [Helianthus anomalus]
MVPKEEIAFKGVSLMKLFSRCKPVGSTPVVAAPLELLTGITCNSCSVASSTVGGLAEIETPDSITCCGIFSLTGD